MRDCYPNVSSGSVGSSAVFIPATGAMVGPSRPLQDAIDGADKSAFVVIEKLEQLGNRLAFVLQPEVSCGEKTCGPPVARQPISDSVERIGSIVARMNSMVAMIDNYMARLDI